MKGLIVLLMSLIVSIFATVAEAAVNQCEIIKGPQIEALCVDVGFDQTAIEYDAYLPVLQDAEQTTIKQPYMRSRAGDNQKAKNLTRHLKKAGTERYMAVKAIQYYNLRSFEGGNRIRDNDEA
jgi:hypothetical protein